MSNAVPTTERSNGDLTDRRPSTPPQLSTETRPSARTSEFFVLIVSSLAVIIAAYLDDAFNVEPGWTLFAVLATGYMISRGIAKAGTCEPYRVNGEY
jgi:hypothetical protein